MTDRPIRLLCVDDDPDIRMIATMSLGLDKNMTVLAASSAEDALSLLRNQDCRFDVILLDVMMPGMDGPQALEQIRAIEQCSSVPVIFMTARARSSDVESYKAIGGAGVIVKPFDPLSLSAQVRALIGPA